MEYAPEGPPEYPHTETHDMLARMLNYFRRTQNELEDDLSVHLVHAMRYMQIRNQF